LNWNLIATIGTSRYTREAYKYLKVLSSWLVGGFSEELFMLHPSRCPATQ
jgi:hypothetical protein